MKGFARKNQLIITGLAIMIAVAGYLHFTSEGGTELSEVETESGETEWIEEDASAELLSDDEDSVETMTELVEDASDTETADIGGTDSEAADADGEETASAEDEYADISAEDLGEDEEQVTADNGETAEDKETADAGETAEDKETADAGETAGEAAEEASSSIGEAVLVNNTITGDYFSSAKLSREQARAKNEETLMEIVNNTKMEEETKQEAVNDLIRLTEISEMETAAETLLGAKGFENAIVTITDESVDVVVDAEGLTKQQIVQIQDIVKRKTKIAAENIVITPVAVEGE